MSITIQDFIDARQNLESSSFTSQILFASNIGPRKRKEIIKAFELQEIPGNNDGFEEFINKMVEYKAKELKKHIEQLNH